MARSARWGRCWRIAAGGLLACRALAVAPLVQLPDLAGCVSESGAGGACTVGVVLVGALSPAVSPDGRSVYVASTLSDAVAVFDRDAATGALTQKAGTAGCVSETGGDGACTEGVALDGPFSVAVSPDGRRVYLASALAGAVAVFTRDVPAVDIDGDGEVAALTDGMLKLRYLFGFRGGILVDDAVDLADCRRCVAADIEAYIAAFLDL